MREFEGPAQQQQAGPRPPSPATPDLAGVSSLLAQRLASPEAVLDLQRSGGNEATVQLLSAQPDADPAESDADPAEGNGAGGGRSPVLDVVGRGGGQPLEGPIRTGMEQALDTDLSDVRIHTDSSAAASARAVQAHAYTVGNEVVFGSGHYQPDSPEGQRMLAHELTHVLQQRSGPVDGTATGDGVAVSHPSDRFEQAAEANADRIMTQGGVGATGSVGVAAASGGGAVAQRALSAELREAPAKDDEEEDAVQGFWVQRQDHENDVTEEGVTEEPETS